MTSKDLLWHYGKFIFCIILFAFSSVVFVINTLSQHMGSFFALDKLVVYHYIIMGGVLVVLGGTVVFFIVRLAGKVNISDTLKGR